MKVLFLLTYQRATNYILPAIEKLSEQHEVYYFCYREMGSHINWENESANTRDDLKARLSDSQAIDLGEPKAVWLPNRDTYTADFQRAIEPHRFDLAVIDESHAKARWGTNLFYNILKRRGTLVVGCQEGLVNPGAGGLCEIASNLGASFDYCFCFGQFDAEHLVELNPALHGRVYPVGIPANDALKTMRGKDHKPKHILVVPTWTAAYKGTTAFTALSDDMLEATGVFELARKRSLRVLIKEKAKRYTAECGFEHLRSQTVDVTWDEKKLDEYVADAALVIGGPSTLMLKPLQCGIPIAVLGEPIMGHFGVLKQFQGLTKSTRDEVFETLAEQDAVGGASKEFIEYAVAGGSEFSSTSLFIDALDAVFRNGCAFEGRLNYGSRDLFEQWWMYHPTSYKRLEPILGLLRGVYRKAVRKK